MEKPWRRLTSGLLAGVMLLSLTACAKSPSSSSSAASGSTSSTAAQRTKITFWDITPQGSDGYDSLQKLILGFNTAQDKYTVQAVGYPFLDYFSKMTTAFAGGVAPDVFLYTLDDVPVRASAGTTMDLSPYIKRDSYSLNDFYPTELKFGVYNGDQYALPFSSTCRLMYYNLDLFKKAGLTAADVPKTWDELYTVAHKMDVVQNGTIKQLGFDPTAGQATYFQYLWQSGLDFFDKDGNPDLNTAANQKVLQWIVDFNKQYPYTQRQAFSDASKTLAADAFVSGRLAMMVSNDAEYKVLQGAKVKFQYGVAPMPLPQNGTRVNWSSCWSIEAIDSKNQSQMDGSWEFIKYMLKPESQTAFYNSQGWLTASKTANQGLETDPIMKTIIEELPYSTEKKFVTYAPKWNSDWDQFMQKATSGTSVTEVLNQAQKFFEQKKENYKSTH